MFRHPLLIAIGVILATTGLVAVVVSTSSPTRSTLKIAVGPRQSEDLPAGPVAVRNISRASGRRSGCSVIRKDGPQDSAEALDSGAVDLAVVRRDVACQRTARWSPFIAATSRC